MAELNSAGRVRPIFKGVWNASTDYGMLDVVTSTNKHAVYMALRTVPAGTLLNETSYWGKMIDAADGIIGNITQEASTADGGENKITVTMGDGTTKTFVVLNGKQGTQGNPGVSPSVSVSKSGTVTTISITDATGTKEAYINDGAAGKDGSNGSNGKDGTPCTHSWSGTTLTVTSASGTSSANLKGADGKTPVKGTDYFTESEKAAIVSDVIGALSTEQWTFTLANGSTVTKTIPKVT